VEFITITAIISVLAAIPLAARNLRDTYDRAFSGEFYRHEDYSLSRSGSGHCARQYQL